MHTGTNNVFMNANMDSEFISFLDIIPSEEAVQIAAIV